MSYISDIIGELLYDLADQAAGCQMEDCAGHLIDNCVVANGRVLAFTTSNAPALASAIETRLERQQQEVERLARTSLEAFSTSPEAARRMWEVQNGQVKAVVSDDGTLSVVPRHLWHTWDLIQHDENGSVSAVCTQCDKVVATCQDGVFKRSYDGALHTQAECRDCGTTPICHNGIMELSGQVRGWTAAELTVWSHFGTVGRRP